MPDPRAIAPGPSPWPQDTGRLILDSTDSTNADGLRRARAGLPQPFWIMARAQTAARGRRGRHWASPLGNFAATRVSAAPEPVTAALYGFVAGLALVDALIALGVDGPRLALKWPNDVLYDGGKLAGILLEGDGTHLAIGIGVNLVSMPAADDLEATARPPAHLGGAVTADALLDRLAWAMDAREAQFLTSGFEGIRAAWLARAAGLGGQITARLADRAITGRFETIDGSGALVLDTGAGCQQITAADIHFG
ncbi:MAG: biotin--[acetyl-CoA-carboxylase] ligase [Pseudomonadota bacterium]